MFFLQKNYIASVEAFSKAVHPLSGDPKKYEGWANLGDALLWLPDRKTEARQAYEKAIELLAPILAIEVNHETLLSRMALYSARIGDKKNSQEMINRTMALGSKSPDVWFRLGLTNELNQQRLPAIQALKNAMHFGFPLSLIEAEPDLVALRKDANFIGRK